MKLAVLLVAGALGALPVGAFESPEHRQAGDGAWKKVVAEIAAGSPDAQARLNALLAPSGGVRPTPEEPICAMANGSSQACFSFGQLVAIYGDWAADVAEVNSPAIAQRAAILKKITAEGGKAATRTEHDHMMQLASVNFTHFSGEALAAYVKWHTLALTTAAADGRKLTEALHYEALALHSFTDLYALGHMLENRELTKTITQWANDAKNSLAIKASGMGALMLGGMVNFYHNAYNWKGGRVRNTAGEEWFATGDGKFDEAGNPGQRDMVIKGAAASLQAVLATALGLPRPPASKYQATRFLPVHFWGTQEPVAPKDQVSKILMLIPAQAMKRRPIQDHGFDFSLGILKWKPGEKKGEVAYAARVAELQGL